MEEITDEYILNLEFIHDNIKDIKKMLTYGYDFYDLINGKILNIEYISDPEENILNLVFNNIIYHKNMYKNISINNNEINVDKDIILVFDNIQFNKINIELLDQIFPNKIKKIFVPFVYIAEQLINVNNKKINDIIDNIKNMDKRVFIDNFYNNNILKSKYKIEADNIGLLIGNNDKLINYKILQNELSKENFFKLMKQLFDLIDNSNYHQNIKNNIDDIKYEIKKLYLDDNNNIDNNKCNNIIVNDKYLYNIVNIWCFLISLKETRDTYYINEILEIKEIYKNHNIIYVTMDEISNCRCILNKISSINIYNGPRYLSYIENDTITIKLFQIYYKFTDNIYKLIKKYTNDNTQIILKNSKAILQKKISKIIGGNNEKTELQTYNINDIKSYIMLQLQTNILINFKKAGQIDDLLSINKFDTIKEISKNNNIYIKAIDELKNIFNWLIKLDDISLDLIKEIKFEKENRVFNGIFTANRIEAEKNKNKYEELMSVKFENMDGFYIGLLISYFYRYHSKNKIELYEYLYPEIFKKYKIYDYFNLIYIEYIIEEKRLDIIL